MLRVKRSYDTMMMDATPACAPFDAQSIFPTAQPAAKRQKHEYATHIQESEFMKPVPYEGNAVTYVKRLAKRNKRRKAKAIAEQRPTRDYVFTEDEVREIVAKALEERELELRNEYDGILSARLSEQFQIFNKFSDDYISSKLKRSEFSYTS